MNYANHNFLLDLVILLVPLAVALGGTMLGSYLIFTLPAWIRRRAHRRAVTDASLPQPSVATVHPLRANRLDLGASCSTAHEERMDRRTA
jgi:hypothetical protein